MIERLRFQVIDKWQSSRVLARLSAENNAQDETKMPDTKD